MGRPSILAVTSEVPWPLDSGGHLRTFHLLRTFTARFDVRLVVPTSGDDEPGRRALEREGIELQLVPVPARHPITEAIKIAGSALRREPYVLFARHRRRAVWRALAAEAHRRRPDAVYLDHLDSLVYADSVPGVPVIIDMHNVYSRLASRAAAEASSPARRLYIAHEARLLARREQLAARKAHTVLAVSNDEARYFSSLGAARVVVVPNGVDCSAYGGEAVDDRPGPPTVLYVGALDWPPNASAARFLATDVLATVRRQIPDAHVTIVGRHPSPDMLALGCPAQHVEVAANVPDVAPYFRAAHVLAVPLEAGGGTRLKILEAFAAGLPVVSTAVGCEGIDAFHQQHLIIAERPRFADAIVEVLNDPVGARQRAKLAQELARDHYDWTPVGRRAADAVANAAVQAGTRSASLTAFRVQTKMSTR
jgi:glycosyltransferase involved in cell wall biosynthesis